MQGSTLLGGFPEFWSFLNQFSIEPLHDKTYKKVCTTSEDSDAHVPSTASGLSKEG